MPFGLNKIQERKTFKVKVKEVPAPRPKKVGRKSSLQLSVDKAESAAPVLTQDHITPPPTPKTSSPRHGDSSTESLTHDLVPTPASSPPAASPSKKRKASVEPAAPPAAKRGKLTDEAQTRKDALERLTESRAKADEKQARNDGKSFLERRRFNEELGIIMFRPRVPGVEDMENWGAMDKKERAKKCAEKRARDERFVPEVEAAARAAKRRADEAGFHNAQPQKSDSETPEGNRPGCHQVGARRYVRYQDLIIEGCWQPVKQLSCDYSGVVWLAQNTKDHRQKDIAIKFPADTYRYRLSSHFRKECEVYDKMEKAGIQHTVTRIFSNWDPEHPKGLYLGMELMDGSAADLNWSKMGSDERNKRASEVVAQIAKVLVAMHKISLVHAHLSPASIFYKKIKTVEGGVKRERFIWKLGDFRNAQQPFTALRGKQMPLFMAPELSRPNGFVSDKVDVWALHIVMLSLTNWGRYNDKRATLGQKDIDGSRYKAYLAFVRNLHTVDARVTRWAGMVSSSDTRRPTMQQVLDRLKATGSLNK